MQKYINEVEKLWEKHHKLKQNITPLKSSRDLIGQVIGCLNDGTIRVASKNNGSWLVNEWVKKAILLFFQLNKAEVFDGNFIKWFDKAPHKFDANAGYEDFIKAGCRIVPGAFIRTGAYIGKNVVVMPSFINIGAYIGDGTMVDTWATIGSCAQVGRDCHISGGVGIGGVLEPLQSRPVIIEDNCFIGARSEIAEGVIIREGAVISMGVFIGASTKIVNRHTGDIIYGEVPPYSVVVPGFLPAEKPNLPGLYCAVIIKQVDESTRRKTAINELLRGE